MVVISTTEQADAMLKHLDACAESARTDNYASERRKPIKWMSCTCCGESMRGRNWWNQEPGYGLCDACATKHCGVADGEESQTYGVRGVHYLIPADELDRPQIIEDRGEPLYGMDERLRIEYDGYVYWKGRQIDHYSGSLLEDSEESREQALEMIRRCEILESRGEVVSSTSVIWRWEEEGVSDA